MMLIMGEPSGGSIEGDSWGTHDDSINGVEVDRVHGTWHPPLLHAGWG